MKTTKSQSIKTEELDTKFEGGESISEYLDLSSLKKAALELKRVNVDFPVWMIASLDKESRRLGVSRQALIKLWIAQKLEKGSV